MSVEPWRYQIRLTEARPTGGRPGPRQADLRVAVMPKPDLAPYRHAEIAIHVAVTTVTSDQHVPGEDAWAASDVMVDVVRLASVGHRFTPGEEVVVLRH